MTTITNLKTGETMEINRCVTHQHPAWVHEQCGTNSEGELQSILDSYQTECYYDADGNHRGPDQLGISMTR